MPRRRPYTGTPTDCYSCHQADYAAHDEPEPRGLGLPDAVPDLPQHERLAAGELRPQQTRFPLTGAHDARSDCAKCHVGGRYAGTPTDCYSCHQANYAATTNPNHAAAGFPTQCQTATTTTRLAAGELRPRGDAVPAHRRPQRGRTARSATRAAATRGRPTDCYSCHQTNYASTTNPNHQAAAFPTQCQTCHTTSAWRPATSDHNKTRFPLTGAHQRVDCARCHVGGRYTGTPTDCNSCHQANYAATTNPNHRSAGFPITCQDCHTTTAWRPASFDHDGRYFPIYSGKHRGKWTSCSECHVNAGNYKAFECILCHEHSNKAKVDSDHKGEKGYVYASSACYQCHRNGRADATGGFRRLP